MFERKYKMKKILSAVLVLCMMLSFVACANEDGAPDGMKNVAGENDAYYLYVPESWSENNNGVVGAKYSNTDTSNISVTAYGGSEYSTVEEYWNAFKAKVPTISTEFEAVKENEPKVVGGMNGVQYVFKMTTGEVKYQVQQVFVLYSNIMYVITYTATEEKFDSHAEDVQKIIDEFKFK